MLMQIGVPKEIKTGETRVSMTPSLCRRCVNLGATVLVEQSAGLRAGFRDDEYREAGATLSASAEEVWASSDLVLKVKEPLSSEYDLMREGPRGGILPARTRSFGDRGFSRLG